MIVKYSSHYHIGEQASEDIEPLVDGEVYYSVSDVDKIKRESLDWELLYQEGCDEVGHLEREVAELKQYIGNLEAHVERNMEQE